MSDVSNVAKSEPAWLPLPLFKAILLSVWHDMSAMSSPALGDRSSFPRFCDFSSSKPTPERTIFMHFRRALIERQLDPVF
ncbi:MAG: transposase [Xanthobacteraceae bacterium]|nr:transposase [Xanthobacteraceae bacterium]